MNTKQQKCEHDAKCTCTFCLNSLTTIQLKNLKDKVKKLSKKIDINGKIDARNSLKRIDAILKLRNSS